MVSQQGVAVQHCCHTIHLQGVPLSDSGRGVKSVLVVSFWRKG